MCLNPHYMLQLYGRHIRKRGNLSRHHKKKGEYDNNAFPFSKQHKETTLGLLSAEHNAPTASLRTGTTTTPQMPEGASQSLGLLLLAHQQLGKVLQLGKAYLLK